MKWNVTIISSNAQYVHMLVENMMNHNNFYNWCNNQEGIDRICSKIDKAMVNAEWISRFPQSWALLLPIGSSNHSPCLVRVADTGREVHKSFRFCDMFITNPGFMEIVRDAWQSLLENWLQTTVQKATVQS